MIDKNRLYVLKFFILIIILIISIHSISIKNISQASSEKYPPEKEYKMLFKTEFFQDYEEGMNRLWEAVKKVAGEKGLSIKEKDSLKIKGPTYIAYLDTENFSLYNSGYILRQRQEYKIGEYNSQKPLELMLKFRNSDMETAVSKDLTASGEFEGNTKFEADIIAGKNNLRTVYSKSTKVDLNNIPGEALSDYIAIFPLLETLNIESSEKIQIVNGKIMEEYEMKPGKVDFGNNIKSKISISVWYYQGESNADRPVIAEFSFKYKSDDTKGEDFIKALQKEIPKWIEEGKTKTEIIYER